ncbi:MAG: hypothetical protein GY740_06355, partial [Gammaproteobacteria bacterium]|nr:hypothetical protein [Gammaproteobacteria bacterium]
MDDALVDVDKEGRFCVSVLNVEQGNKVYVDKGQVIGTLEAVENVCSVKDYLAKLPMSSNDDQFVAKAEGDQDTFHLEVTDETERKRLLKEKLCFDGDCDATERRKVAEMCSKYSRTFALTENELGRCNFMTASIESGDAPPFVEPPRRVPFRKQAMIDEELD